jgi:DNA-binding FadR family transcriptional regulator
MGVKERGWFASPRSLPMILRLLGSKGLKNGKTRLGEVYLELLSRHIDEGLVEMVMPEEHAHAAGFTSTRAQRDWREHMQRLEALGFIKSRPRGNMPYGYVLLVHPTRVAHQLHSEKKSPKGWYEQYQARQAELKEPSYAELVDKRKS